MGSNVSIRINGRDYFLDSDVVSSRIAGTPPDPIRTHWVRVGQGQWPVKQALRIALGDNSADFISHEAIRAFRKLGFETSLLPGESGRSANVAEADPPTGSGDPAVAFGLIEPLLADGALSRSVRLAESMLDGADRDRALQALQASGFTADAVRAAMLVRDRIGQLNTLLHASVMCQVIPLILGDGERLVAAPSLGAGAGGGAFDLETNLRVAEFKMSMWRGGDGARQAELLGDVAKLAADTTGRRRELYVLGGRPVAFLANASSNAVDTLRKGRHRRTDHLDPALTVAELVTAERINVIDMQRLLPGMR